MAVILPSNLNRIENFTISRQPKYAFRVYVYDFRSPIFQKSDIKDDNR